MWGTKLIETQIIPQNDREITRNSNMYNTYTLDIDILLSEAVLVKNFD